MPQRPRPDKYPRSNQDIYQYESHNSTGNNRQYYSRVKKHGHFITQECIPLLKERLKSVQEYYDILIAE